MFPRKWWSQVFDDVQRLQMGPLKGWVTTAGSRGKTSPPPTSVEEDHLDWDLQWCWWWSLGTCVQLWPDLVLVDHFPQLQSKQRQQIDIISKSRKAWGQAKGQSIEVYAPGQTSMAPSSQYKTPTRVFFLLLVQPVWPWKLHSQSRNSMQSSLVTTQNVFAVLKASPGLILKCKSGKQLNFISLVIFLGQS